MSHLDLEVPGGVMLAVFLLNGGARGVALQAIPEGARGLTKAHMGAILGVATLGVGAEV